MKIRNMFIFQALFVGLIFFLSHVTQPFAQETKSDEYTLEEIVVTAAKRGGQDIQKVPISMDVISDKDLASEGKTNVDDILSGLASVLINTNADGMRVSIRGIADTDPVISGRKSASPTVAFNVDGAYTIMNTAGQNLFDLERIEVLMGPQSTLYAANSPGGVVNIITNVPKTDRYSAEVTGLYGNYNHSDLQAALNAPIVEDRLAIRLALSRTRENSFMKPYRDQVATKNNAARLKLLWKASDDLEITLTGNYAKNGGLGDELYLKAKAFDKASSSSWTADPNAAGSFNPLDQITKSATVTISWNSPVGNLTIAPNYSKNDSSGDQAGNITIANQTTVQTSWSSARHLTQEGAEARLASSEDFKLFQYVIGATYYKSKYNTTLDYEQTYSDQNTWNINKAKQKAVYGNITYPLPFNDKLSVTAGYRRSWDFSREVGITMAMKGYDETQMDVSRPDYKIGFQYDLSDKTMFYGSYTSSFRTDSMVMSNNDGVRPPEELNAYTAGAKTRMFDNTVQANASAYYYDQLKFGMDSTTMQFVTEGDLRSTYFAEGTTTVVRGKKVTIPNGTSYWDWLNNSNALVALPGNLYMIMDNGFTGWGKVRTIGFDASVSWIASPRDMVNFSLSYLDMKWTDLTFNYIYEAYFKDQTYDGRTAPNAPKFSISASYEHYFNIGSYGTLTPRIDVQHKTGYDLIFNQSGTDGEARQEGYFLYNASAAFNSLSGRWSMNANVKNITNYAVKRTYDVMSKTLRIGDPRTYEVTLSLKF